MSESGKIRLQCPECDAELVVDAATGELLFHKKAREPVAGGRGFDDLFAELDQGKADAEEAFQREVEAMKDKDRLLEEKFQEAMKRAEEEPDDEPPHRPWDLD